MLRPILQPFIVDFVLACVMHPLVEFLRKRGIPKNFSIIAAWVCVLVLLIAMFVMLMPVLYDEINELMTGIVDGIVWISNKIETLRSMKDFSLVNNITNNIINILQSYDDWIPQLVSSLPGLMNAVLNVVANVLLSIIVAIYMLFDFERIKCGLRKFIHLFFKNSDIYLHGIDQNITVYLKSLIILMLVKFTEYFAFYFMVGHQDWLIVDLLTSFGVIIPYLDDMIASSISTITALTLPPNNIMALIIGIIVLSNVSTHVISPLVHEEHSTMDPLITLFAVFAGGVIMGAVGIIVSIPTAIVTKTAVEVYEQKTDRRLYSNAMELGV